VQSSHARFVSGARAFVRARGKSAVSGAARPPQAKLDFRLFAFSFKYSKPSGLHSLSPNSHTYCSTVLLNTCGVQRTAPRQGGVQSARWLPASFILKNTVRKKTKNFSFEAVASLIDRYSRSPRSATSLGRGNQATGRLGYWVAALQIARTATSPSCLETPSYSTSLYPVERASAPLLRSTPEVTSMLAVP
jgi:hypothetical protein